MIPKCSAYARRYPWTCTAEGCSGWSAGAGKFEHAVIARLVFVRIPGHAPLWGARVGHEVVARLKDGDVEAGFERALGRDEAAGPRADDRDARVRSQVHDRMPSGPDQAAACSRQSWCSRQ